MSEHRPVIELWDEEGESFVSAECNAAGCEWTYSRTRMPWETDPEVAELAGQQFDQFHYVDIRKSIRTIRREQGVTLTADGTAESTLTLTFATGEKIVHKLSTLLVLLFLAAFPVLGQSKRQIAILVESDRMLHTLERYEGTIQAVATNPSFLSKNELLVLQTSVNTVRHDIETFRLFVANAQTVADMNRALPDLARLVTDFSYGLCPAFDKITDRSDLPFLRAHIRLMDLSLHKITQLAVGPQSPKGAMRTARAGSNMDGVMQTVNRYNVTPVRKWKG